MTLSASYLRRAATALSMVMFLAWANATPAQTAGPVVSFGNLPVLQPATPQPGHAHIQSDFNGDGMSDVLWFNPTTSQLGYWTMSIGVPTASDRAISHTATRTWQIATGYFAAAVGDFNGDGYADIVFTSAIITRGPNTGLAWFEDCRGLGAEFPRPGEPVLFRRLRRRALRIQTGESNWSTGWECDLFCR